jgi:hypothetical protein
MRHQLEELTDGDLGMCSSCLWERVTLMACKDGKDSL